MTAKTSQQLADTLRAAGLKRLAERAEADEFHDFLSPHALPEVVLAELLMHEAVQNAAAVGIRQRLINGEFDASTEESDDWAASPDGQATFNELVKEIKP